MTVVVNIRPSAKADLAEILMRYEAANPHVAVEFRRTLDAAMSQIASFPSSAPRIGDGLRRLLLCRFPYGIFYRQAGASIDVVAVIHNSRNPLVWKARSH